jgi:hypothetical protein
LQGKLATGKQTENGETMKATNYDQSSSGLNLDLSIFFDTERSRFEFDECFNVLQHSRYRTHSILEYLDFGNVAPSFDFADLTNYNFTKKELIQALKAGGYWDQGSAKYLGYDLYKSTKQELIDYLLEAGRYDDIAEFLKEHFTANYETLVSRGYCQGDQSEIVYSKQAIEWLTKETNKAWEELKPILQKEADNLLWDSPIYGRLTINEDEIYLDELLKDPYIYDKDQLLSDFVKTYQSKFSENEFKIIVDFLSDNLPEYLDYV